MSRIGWGKRRPGTEPHRPGCIPVRWHRHPPATALRQGRPLGTANRRQPLRPGPRAPRQQTSRLGPTLHLERTLLPTDQRRLLELPQSPRLRARLPVCRTSRYGAVRPVGPAMTRRTGSAGRVDCRCRRRLSLGRPASGSGDAVQEPSLRPVKGDVAGDLVVDSTQTSRHFFDRDAVIAVGSDERYRIGHLHCSIGAYVHSE
jgi:hypothetical protein